MANPVCQSGICDFFFDRDRFPRTLERDTMDFDFTEVIIIDTFQLGSPVLLFIEDCDMNYTSIYPK